MFMKSKLLFVRQTNIPFFFHPRSASIKISFWTLNSFQTSSVCCWITFLSSTESTCISLLLLPAAPVYMVHNKHVILTYLAATIEFFVACFLCAPIVSVIVLSLFTGQNKMIPPNLVTWNGSLITSLSSVGRAGLKRYKHLKLKLVCLLLLLCWI